MREWRQLPCLCRRPASRHEALRTQQVFRESLDPTRGMFGIQFVGMRSRAFRLGKGDGLRRPRSLVTRLINASRGTTTTTILLQGKDFTRRERRREETGNDWSAMSTWRPSWNHRDCPWVQMSRPAVRGPRHRDVGHLVVHLRAWTRRIPVRLARSGGSVRSTRQQDGQKCQFTTGGSPEPRSSCSEMRNSDREMVIVPRPQQQPKRRGQSTTGSL